MRLSTYSSTPAFAHLESPFLRDEIRLQPVSGEEPLTTDEGGEDEAPAEAEAFADSEDFTAPFGGAHEAQLEDRVAAAAETVFEVEPESAGETHEAMDEALVDPEPEASLEADWEVAFEHDTPVDLPAAEAIDEAAAQPVFTAAIADRIEPLLPVKALRDAVAWNAARHPSASGIAIASLLARLARYVNRSRLEQAMQTSTALAGVARDDGTVLAAMAHQFQQKVYKAKGQWDGKIGEGTLDALGFVRHGGDALNRADATNVAFHVKGRSKAFQRLEQVYRSDRQAFQALGPDVTPQTWYALFVTPPFLGWSFGRGVHIELMRRLRRAEAWLLQQPQYRGMTPVQLGDALGIDELHAGGRATNNNSMHTLGLAIDIRYRKNPWVAGQHNNEGKPNSDRNGKFQTAVRRASRLMAGEDETITPQWLQSLGDHPRLGTAGAHAEIQRRHANLVAYLALERDPAGLRAAIERRRQGPGAQWATNANESVDAAVQRWRATIRSDREALRTALAPGRDPGAGFMNLHADLVVALRDHGCLAWGAIDLGRGACGDMMHFDCRAEGIGWHLSLERQRTTGAGHPCRTSGGAGAVRVAPAREMDDLEREWDEREDPVPGSASSVVPFRGGRLWTFRATTLPMKIAIFCPKALATPSPLDLLVYAHGLIPPCPPLPKDVPEDFITKAPFELGKLVDASGRRIALVVPFMDWGNLKKHKLNFEACNKDTHHGLGLAANLNGVVNEVLAEIGRVHGARPPSLQNLILAGHSKAYEFFNTLAITHLDPEASKGALASLSEVWALDSTYVCYLAEWKRWIASRPKLRVFVFYRPKTSTAACALKLAGAAADFGTRLSVKAVGEGHCQVPAKRLPGLLGSVPVAGASEVEDESYAEELGEADVEQTELEDEWDPAGEQLADEREGIDHEGIDHEGIDHEGIDHEDLDGYERLDSDEASWDSECEA